MSHIFISYSRKNFDFAGKIVQALAENALDTWIDRKSIPKGEDWEMEIYRGIEEADAFLFLISPDSVASQMCNKEIEHAVKNGKRILPIVIRDAGLKNIHPEISKRNWIFCRDGQDNFDKAIEETRKTIHTDYEWLKYHTKLQVKALDWERTKDSSRLLRGKELREAEQQLTEVSIQEDPQPTKIQREYILASQRNEIRTRRQITVGLGLGFAVVAVLAVFAWAQRNIAVTKENARATAQAQAEEQANIAIARQLVVQAQALLRTDDSNQLAALLLATESMKLNSSSDAAEILNTNTHSGQSISMKHDSWITSIAYSPDGKYIVSGSWDETARVWNAKTGEEICRVIHDGIPIVVAFSPNRKYIATGANDKILRISDAATCAELTRMEHEHTVTAISFSPDSKYIASAAIANTVHVWETATGIEVSRQMHPGKDNTIDYSPNGLYVVSGTINGEILVWDPFTGKTFYNMKHNGTVKAISPDGKLIVSSGTSGTARVWVALTGEEITQLENRAFFKFSPDGNIFLSGSSDGIITIFDISKNFTKIDDFNIGESISRIVFSQSGKYFATTHGNRTVRVWDIASKREISRITHDNNVTDASFSPDEKYIASGSEDSTVRIWNVLLNHEPNNILLSNAIKEITFSPNGQFWATANKGEIQIWDSTIWKKITSIAQQSTVTKMSFIPNGYYLFVESADNVLRMYDSASGKQMGQISMDYPIAPILVLSPDGKLALTMAGKTATVWELPTLKQISQKTMNLDILAAVFSKDSKYVAMSSQDKTVLVWEVKTGNKVSRLRDQSIRSWIHLLAFTADENFVVTNDENFSSYDKNIKIWDLRSSKIVTTLDYSAVGISQDGEYLIADDSGRGVVVKLPEGNIISRTAHIGAINFLSFSPDQRYVVSVTDNHTVRVWEVLTGKEIARKTYLTNVVLAAFTPDGKYIASRGSEDIIQIWPWMPDDIIEETCSSVPRNLTRAEWTQYIGNALPYQAVCPNLPIEPEVIMTPTP